MVSARRPPIFLITLGTLASVSAAPATGISLSALPENITYETDQKIAQVALPSDLPPDAVPSEPLPPADVTPSLESPSDQLPETPLPPQLPPVDELLGDPDGGNTPDGITSGPEEKFVISGIELDGSTVFTNEDFAELFESYIDRPITFNELLQFHARIKETQSTQK